MHGQIMIVAVQRFFCLFLTLLHLSQYEGKMLLITWFDTSTISSTNQKWLYRFVSSFTEPMLFFIVVFLFPVKDPDFCHCMLSPWLYPFLAALTWVPCWRWKLTSYKVWPIKHALIKYSVRLKNTLILLWDEGYQLWYINFASGIQNRNNPTTSLLWVFKLIFTEE